MVFDGEGGYKVTSRLMPAEESLSVGGLPHNVMLKRNIGKGERISWNDVEIDKTSEAYRIRRELEDSFALTNSTQ